MSGRKRKKTFCPFVIRQEYTECDRTCEVRLLARLLVPLRDFLFLACRGMFQINVWRTKRSKVKQHNTNSADEVFYVKEITAVYVQTFLKLWYFVLRKITLRLVFAPE